MIDSLDAREYRDWAKDDLMRYKDAKKDIDHFKEKIDSLRAKAQRISKPLDPNKVQVQANNNGPEEILCIIADMSLEMRERQTEAERICMEIGTRIGKLPNNLHQRILRDFYMYNQTLQNIGIMEGYCYSRIKDYHQEALEVYGKTYKEKDKPQSAIGI